MHPARWLEDVFGSRMQVRVLRALCHDAGKMWTERELARALDANPSSIHAAVGRLRRTNILEFRRLGTSNAFRLRSGNRLAQRIQTCLSQETGLMEDLLERVASATPRQAAVYLYGSTQDTPRAASDVDLAVLAPSLAAAEDAAATIRAAVLEVGPLRTSITIATFEQARDPPAWLAKALQGRHLAGIQVRS